MADIDRVFRGPRHLVTCLEAGRDDVVAVKTAFARLGHGVEDAVISAAAAQMTGKCRPDVLPRRCRRSLGCPPAIVKGRCLHDKTRRAESALQGIVRHEGLLDRMQLAGADAFDGRHRFTRRGARRHQTAHHRSAVHQHGARAADAGPAHELRSRELERVPHDIDEKALGVIGEGLDAAVDRHRAHSRSPGFRRTDFLRRLASPEAASARRWCRPAKVRSMISRSVKKATAG